MIGRKQLTFQGFDKMVQKVDAYFNSNLTQKDNIPNVSQMYALTIAKTSNAAGISLLLYNFEIIKKCFLGLKN